MLAAGAPRELRRGATHREAARPADQAAAAAAAAAAAGVVEKLNRQICLIK
jgi:hypothetical protein